MDEFRPLRARPPSSTLPPRVASSSIFRISVEKPQWRDFSLCVEGHDAFLFGRLWVGMGLKFWFCFAFSSANQRVSIPGVSLPWNFGVWPFNLSDSASNPGHGYYSGDTGRNQCVLNKIGCGKNKGWYIYEFFMAGLCLWGSYRFLRLGSSNSRLVELRLCIAAEIGPCSCHLKFANGCGRYGSNGQVCFILLRGGGNWWKLI